MLIRIVKLQVKKENIASFERLFDANKKKIRNFRGCKCLVIYKDRNVAGLYFTYSHWDTEESLEHYRDSEVFRTVWGEVKKLFRTPPEAWSLDVLETNN